MAPIQPIVIPETPTLVIDASSPTVFVGILGEEGVWLGRENRQGMALETLFSSVGSVFSSTCLGFENCRGYLYCEGPGSTLGLRLSAMAIETWCRIHPASARLFAFDSLRLTAALIALDHPDMTDALLVSDWKKNAWHTVAIKNGKLAGNEVMDSAKLAEWKDPLFHLPQRKGWQPPPKRAVGLEYEPGRLPEAARHFDLLRSVEEVELHRSGRNAFRKWAPERHRKPVH